MRADGGRASGGAGAGCAPSKARANVRTVARTETPATYDAASLSLERNIVRRSPSASAAIEPEVARTAARPVSACSTMPMVAVTREGGTVAEAVSAASVNAPSAVAGASPRRASRDRNFARARSSRPRSVPGVHRSRCAACSWVSPSR